MEEFQSLTINVAREFHSYLIQKFQSEDSITIDLQNIQQIDMSCIQLLLSAQKTAHNLQKEFSIININENLMEVFSLTGTDIVLGV